MNYDDDITPEQLMFINNYFIECNTYSEMTYEQLERKPVWRGRENYYYQHELRAKYGLTLSKLNLN